MKTAKEIRNAGKITLAGIRQYIRDWRFTLMDSYSEPDGVVRDEKIMRELHHLAVAERLLTKKHLRAPIPAFLSS
jgi:hypothetical protein